MSDFLQPHGLQHARLPCPSPTPGACSNSCPLSRWCHPTISSSFVPFSCPQSFPASGSFPMSRLFASGGQSIGVSASVLPMNIQGWFPLGLTNPGISLEGMMLKLKLQYFGHLMRRTDSLEKNLMLGKIEGRRRRDREWGGWMASLTQWTRVWANSGRWWKAGKPGMQQLMGLQRVRPNWATEQQ